MTAPVAPTGSVEVLGSKTSVLPNDRFAPHLRLKPKTILRKHRVMNLRSKDGHGSETLLPWYLGLIIE